MGSALIVNKCLVNENDTFGLVQSLEPPLEVASLSLLPPVEVGKDAESLKERDQQEGHAVYTDRASSKYST